jgi:ABC-type lipoprotein release transport system permease subunit
VTDLTLHALAQVYLSSGGPEFVSSTLKRLAITTPLPPHEQSVALFRSYLQRQVILDIESAADSSAIGQTAAERRTLWLVGVAFIVCVVGIANAMLMSVMERFREIATMKCLGATDGFVMVLFVLESCVQGLAGGLAGALLGLLVALPQSALQFGNILWQTLNVHDLFNISLSALATGVILAGIASVYPAYVAARLAPMEAMRLE